MERLRVIYSKSKETIYLSHLDVMRLFEQALSRANITVEYSKGFNPRPEIVFAHPLSIGIESTGEVVDILITEKLEISYFIKEMNKVLPNGITILSAEYATLDEKSIMARVYAATYLITFVNNTEKFVNKTKKQIEDIKKEYIKNMDNYLSQNNILVLKKTKNRTERIDIKHQIFVYEFTLDNDLEITVATGQKNNLKPETIMSGYIEYIDEKIPYSVKRTKIVHT
ncbi:MAG: TIGR03936 family radical SAM-associated protein [Clostridia bacterium]